MTDPPAAGQRYWCGVRGNHIAQGVTKDNDMELNKHFIGREVSQYELTGRYVKTYKTISEAGKQTGIPDSAICRVAQGKRWSTQGYRWSYLKLREGLKERRRIRTVRKVSQYTMDGKYIKTFSNCATASKSLNISQGNIHSVANGHRNSTNKYLFRFTDDKTNLTEPRRCQCCGKWANTDDMVAISFECLQGFKEGKGIIQR